jgi:hypothetical protein
LAQHSRLGLARAAVENYFPLTGQFRKTPRALRIVFILGNAVYSLPTNKSANLRPVVESG